MPFIGLISFLRKCKLYCFIKEESFNALYRAYLISTVN